VQRASTTTRFTVTGFVRRPGELSAWKGIYADILTVSPAAHSPCLRSKPARCGSIGAEIDATTLLLCPPAPAHQVTSVRVHSESRRKRDSDLLDSLRSSDAGSLNRFSNYRSAGSPRSRLTLVSIVEMAILDGEPYGQSSSGRYDNYLGTLVGAAGLEPATLGLEVVKTSCDGGRP